MLEHGAKHSDDPFHWPVLGTSSEAGCSLRSVILRQADGSNRTLVCHTDARSVKVQEIMHHSRTSWIFYNPSTKVQVRVSGKTTLHAHDTFADQQWASTRITSRLNYCASRPPGTPIDQPSSGIPDFLLKKIPTLLETEMGREHFMAIQVHIDLIDWLILKVSGNRRAQFKWIDGALRSTWTVP
jgi:hypothetical protein